MIPGEPILYLYIFETTCTTPISALRNQGSKVSESVPRFDTVSIGNESVADVELFTITDHSPAFDTFPFSGIMGGFNSGVQHTRSHEALKVSALRRPDSSGD